MIDKYQLLYLNIKRLQEERQKEQQAFLEMKRNEQRSINPFSIASSTSHPTKEEIRQSNEKTGERGQQASKESEEEQKENQSEDENRHQSGGETKKKPKMVDVGTSPMESGLPMIKPVEQSIISQHSNLNNSMMNDSLLSPSKPSNISFYE